MHERSTMEMKQSLNDFRWKLQFKRMPPTNHEKKVLESIRVKCRVFQTNLSCLAPSKSSHLSCTWSQVMRVEKDKVSKRVEWANECSEGWKVCWSNLGKIHFTMHPKWQQWENLQPSSSNTESREIRASLKSEALASFLPITFNYTNKENTFLLLVNKRSHSEVAPTIKNVII